MANSFCSVCNACGCGVKLVVIDGKFYCTAHAPQTSTSKVDDQVLTPQQKLNLS